ncbi:MAG: hypothetical protein K5778_10885 [Bacteroidaceae bacterium]|nr:hypothetical protein [Bacteroidaceae bacterium]
MKKISMIVFVSMLCMAAKAQTATDVSTMDNVVYMEPVTIAAGTTQTLSIKMKNTVGIQTVQFDMVFPEGIRVALDDDNYEMFFLSTARTTARKMDSFSAVTLSDGHYRVLINSTKGETFDGTDGEIVQVTVNVAATGEAGDRTVLIKDIVLVDTGSNGFRTDEVNTVITVVAAGEIRTVLDETSTVLPADETAANVLVKRTLKANEWSTIVLPFGMSATQWKGVFGDDARLMEFTGYEIVEDGDDVVGIYVKFSEVAAGAPFEANHPYVLKVSSPVSEFTVDGVDIEVEDEPVVATVKRTRRQWSELIGTYVTNTEVPEKTLFLSGNKFWYSKGLTKMMGMRAYFDFYDVLTVVEESSVKAVMDYNDEATAIVDLNAPTADNVYGVDGVYYGNNVELDRLPKGTYIINGKKVFKNK